MVNTITTFPKDADKDHWNWERRVLRPLSDPSTGFVVRCNMTSSARACYKSCIHSSLIKCVGQNLYVSTYTCTNTHGVQRGSPAGPKNDWKSVPDPVLWFIRSINPHLSLVCSGPEASDYFWALARPPSNACTPGRASSTSSSLPGKTSRQFIFRSHACPVSPGCSVIYWPLWYTSQPWCAPVEEHRSILAYDLLFFPARPESCVIFVGQEV